MVTLSHGIRPTRRANIAHGVRPPLTANVKRPWSSMAALARSATYSAPRSATLSASGSTSSSRATSGLALLLVVSAELLAHRREQLVRELVEPAGREARVQRRSQNRCGDAHVDRCVRRPTALTGIGYASGELLEAGRCVQRLRRQVEEPGPDDAPTPPDLRHLCRVDLVLVELWLLERRGLGVRRARPQPRIRVLDDVQPLRVRGHDPVLDAVVDHLHEMPGAVRAAVVVAVLGRLGLIRPPGRTRRRVDSRCDRGEDRTEAIDDLLLAADHQAEATFESPDASARADVDVVNPLRLQGRCVPKIVAVVGVAAVDDRVP